MSKNRFAETPKEFQNLFFRIYYSKNTRDYTLHTIAVMISESLNKVNKLILKTNTEDLNHWTLKTQEEKEELGHLLANIFAWIMAFCNMINGLDVTGLFSQYYSGEICHYCEKNPCECGDKKTREKQSFSRSLNSEALSLQEIQKMLNNVYGEKNREMGFIKIWLHLSTESCELSESIRRNGWKDDAKSELADLIAWFLAVCNFFKIDIAPAIFKRYNGVCDICEKNPCECPMV